MPSEWPRQTVTAVVTMNSANAPQVNASGPPARATIVMPEIHSDLTGFQCTLPSTAEVASASNMRGERNVLADWRNASSMGSAAVARASALAAVMPAGVGFLRTGSVSAV